jgi:uncharacterized protein (TIGR03089 family)
MPVSVEGAPANQVPVRDPVMSLTPSPTVTDVFTALLQRRNSRSGSTPLLTYYDETRRERIELSGISFANWVDKTAGLLADDVLTEAGDRVRLSLAHGYPAHWVTLVWVAASWRAGCTVVLDGDAEVGPEDADQLGDVERIACSLHPLGLGFGRPLPHGVIDYGVEVRAHPDVFGGPHPPPSETAWIDADRTVTQADVIRGVRLPPEPTRQMIPIDGRRAAWDVVTRALVVPVVSGGSAVLVVGADKDRVSAIASAERATLQMS